MHSVQKHQSNIRITNQGFTLVELIVVMSLLAILAAIISPSVLGYVDEAKNKQYIVHARTAVTAAQAELSTLYSAGKLSLTASEKQTWKSHYEFPDDMYLAVDTISDKDHIIEGRERNAYTISRAIYMEDGVYVEYDGEEYRVIDVGGTYVLPIVFMGAEGETSDNVLMNR